jgi:hypothetical protein
MGRGTALHRPVLSWRGDLRGEPEGWPSEEAFAVAPARACCCAGALKAQRKLGPWAATVTIDGKEHFLGQTLLPNIDASAEGGHFAPPSKGTWIYRIPAPNKKTALSLVHDGNYVRMLLQVSQAGAWRTVGELDPFSILKQCADCPIRMVRRNPCHFPSQTSICKSYLSTQRTTILYFLAKSTDCQ